MLLAVFATIARHSANSGPGPRQSRDAADGWRRGVGARGQSACPRQEQRDRRRSADRLALAEAGKAWKNKEYTSSARRIALAIGRRTTYPSIFGPALSPGVNGFGRDDAADGPSSISPIGCSRLRRAGGNRAGSRLAGPAPERPFADRRGPVRPSPIALGLDLAEIRVQPAAAFPRRFGYEVVRVPLYLAGRPLERARIAALVDSWAVPPTFPLP